MPQTHFGLLINEPVQLIEHVLHMQGHEQTSFIRNQTEYDGDSKTSTGGQGDVGSITIGGAKNTKV